jgi:hypothetical protein
MTTAELEARNMTHDEMVGLLCRLEDASYIPPITITREILHRMTIAERIVDRLEDSLFYARMYKDASDDGRTRREEMIDDAVYLISLFRNGGIYP